MLFKRSGMLILVFILIVTGCVKHTEKSYGASTDEWQFIYETYVEEKEAKYIIHEKMVARYIGSEESLPNEELNIVFKSNYTEMWFSDDINLTETDQRVFELSGSITISSLPEVPYINANIVTGSSVETIRLLELEN